MCRQDLNQKEKQIKDALDTTQEAVFMIATNFQLETSDSVRPLLGKCKIILLASLTAILAGTIFILIIIIANIVTRND